MTDSSAIDRQSKGGGDTAGENGQLPPRKEIIGPSIGWQPSTYYEALVSYKPTNPIHKVVVYSGFLQDGQPSSYAAIWGGSYEEVEDFRRAYYLRVIKPLFAAR